MELLGSVTLLGGTPGAFGLGRQRPMMNAGDVTLFVSWSLLGWVAVLSATLVGYLACLAIKEMRRQRQLEAQGQRLGLKGISVLVRGRGFRPVLEMALPTGSPGIGLSQAWTSTAPELDRPASPIRPETEQAVPPAGRRRSAGAVCGTRWKRHGGLKLHARRASPWPRGAL